MHAHLYTDRDGQMWGSTRVGWGRAERGRRGEAPRGETELHTRRLISAASLLSERSRGFRRSSRGRTLALLGRRSQSGRSRGMSGRLGFLLCETSRPGPSAGVLPPRCSPGLRFAWRLFPPCPSLSSRSPGPHTEGATHTDGRFGLPWSRHES